MGYAFIPEGEKEKKREGEREERRKEGKEERKVTDNLLCVSDHDQLDEGDPLWTTGLT